MLEFVNQLMKRFENEKIRQNTAMIAVQKLSEQHASIVYSQLALESFSNLLFYTLLTTIGITFGSYYYLKTIKTRFISIIAGGAFMTTWL